MEQSIDSKLVVLARAGNKHAFEQLIERYFQMVKRIAVGMVANEDIARELMQEAFLHAYLSLDHLRDDSRFKSWLYGITLNVCRSYIREQKTTVLSLESMMGGMRCNPSAVLAMIEDPQTLVERRELQRFVFDAVHSLSPGDREATLLFYYEELSLQEIATVLGISVVAVKGRLHRARKQLRELLAALYPMKQVITPIKEEQRRTPMIKMHIHSVRINADIDQRIVILQEEKGPRILSIWIAQPEAYALAAGLAHTSMPRPMTAQLMANLLKVTETQLEEVRIESMKDEIFYAVVKVRNGDKVQEVDARPSDALTLAVLMNAPIYTTEGVMERAGITLPEGKTIKTDKQDYQGAIFKMLESQSKFILTLQESSEEAHALNRRRMIAFLTGEEFA